MIRFAFLAFALAAPLAHAELPDPTVAGPDIYKPIFENDKVRILEVTFAPGAKIALHKHPDHAAYILSSGTLRLSGPDGKASDAQLEAGKAVFLSATAHAAENTTKQTVKCIVVELKPGASHAKAPAGEDPGHAGPSIYKEILANDKVRVFETTFAPGAKIAMHAHPDHAAYVVEGGKLKISQPGKDPTVFDLKAGTGLFVPAQLHAAENVGGTEVKVIVFELR